MDEPLMNSPVDRTTKFDIEMTRRALNLATRGVGQVSPSPLVGCVIVSPQGDVVGEAFYLFDSVKHAETMALEQAGEQARGGTAFVSLEPHAHFGRTPPCTEALIRAGIRRVVAPIEDPNPDVAGKGFAHLREAGVDVVTGVLAKEAERINERYITALRKGRPFIHLKVATSLDGKIATRTGESKWITGAEARARAHVLRHEADAILVGANTAIKDDPVLTDRSGLPRRRPLVRVVLDGKLNLPLESQLVRTADTWPLVVFGNVDNNVKAAQALRGRGVTVQNDASGGRDLQAVLNELSRLSIQSILIEGGAAVSAAFAEAGLIDKFTFFLAPMIIGGAEAKGAIAGLGPATLDSATRLEDLTVSSVGPDIEITAYPRRQA
jgi:diaminohydroxyphosphoribosylaminopyrimidine deaminase/5-amino-6-(5-phosphoribosylamino)uracil reductase